MKTVAVQLPDEVYTRAERRAEQEGADLPGEIAELVKRYGEATPTPEALANGASSFENRFVELVTQWRKATEFVSATTDMVLHPAYQQIIGMGQGALPLIFAEMRRHPGQWFWALKAITGDDPVAPADRGKVRRMTEAWLEWAQRRGY